MRNYLGEIDVSKDPVLNPFYGAGREEYALIFIGMYGGIDGSHHKDWVLDQVVRILNGTRVIVTLAQWDDGHRELRFKLDEPSEQYNKWVENLVTDENGDIHLDCYSTGIAP